MSTASPTAFLQWSIISTLFLTVMCCHLWRYDKFNCLRWNSGRKPGAFKRVMTYSYLITVPLITIFSIGMTLIKFKEGWLILPNGSLYPKPFTLYSTIYKPWILPLCFVLSLAWAFELVTHLEELMFWLFILHQSPGKDNWFSSWEFVLWCFGSITAVVLLPMTAFATRDNLLTCDAWVILVGSMCSTINTIAFLYVLWTFPAFIRYVGAEGIGPHVIFRLVKFYRLNLARVAFRLLFTLPLLAVSIDALRKGDHPINRNLFWDDLLFMAGATGCFFSSALTLSIFFPISLITEAEYEATASFIGTTTHHLPDSKRPSIEVPRFYQRTRPEEPAQENEPGLALHRLRRVRSLDLEADRQSMFETAPPYNSNGNDQSHTVPPAMGLTRSVSAFPRPCPSSVHLYVATFTSPIDLAAVSAKSFE